MKKTGIALIIFLIFLTQGMGKNIDLVTLPDRVDVQLTIYNSADITLVKEYRYITFKKGVNRLQFSWSGTLIDPTSVEFRPLEKKDKVEVVHTTFPGQKPKHLIWNINSKYEGQVKVEVSYFTSGLTWNMDYVAITDSGEESMNFKGFVRVYNKSGENYENAQVRLIVGKINLVEKISDLARRSGYNYKSLPKAGKARFKRLALRSSFSRAEDRKDSSVYNKKRIVKEGLSEYFMFSISGTETIKNGWSKRMRAVNAENTRFKIVYRLRTHQYGSKPVRFFIWQNDEKHKLGDSPLPNGKIRVFRRNRKDGLSYLGEQMLRYVPIKGKIEINLGVDDLVVFSSVKKKSKRYNFSFYKKYVRGWNEELHFVDRIRNYRKKAIVFELRRVWNGHIEYQAIHKTKLFDYRTVETTFKINSFGKVDYPYELIFYRGYNKKQNRIILM
ncbi:MAG: hypothetical protein KAS64_08680 [Spirochaetes bacterium]|nr:hypothetical protein [Spirochaetota bacterium]